MISKNKFHWLQYWFLSSWTSGTATPRYGRWTLTRLWPMGWLSRYIIPSSAVFSLQTLELDDTLQCVVECRSLAKLESPIAFGDQNYLYGPRPCKEKHLFQKLMIRCQEKNKQTAWVTPLLGKQKSVLWFAISSVKVSGELSNNGEPMRRFMQTFVLAPQSPKKYYVHNDIFRYQDEVSQLFWSSD